ncbi:MAG: hypothetical protein R3F59_29340 [Myxococcota bacterium]
MRRSLPVLLVLAACQGDAPPNLLLELEGHWTGSFGSDEGSVPASAHFTWSDDDEALQGELTLSEPEGDRAFTVLDAASVEELGVSLGLVEEAGVRELYLDALVPLAPYQGAWRQEWYCGEGELGFCELSGGFLLVLR